MRQQAPLPLYRRVFGWALNFPLFYKILIANAVLVVAAAMVGSWLGGRHTLTSPGHSFHWEFGLSFGVIALSAVVVVNYAILRAALQPISVLTRLIAALRRGEVHVRAERPLFGDRDSTLLIQTANSLLDGLAEYRSRIADLSQRVTEQLETERRNIARELHDETAQNLVTLLVLERMIDQAHDPAQQAQALEEIRQLTRLTLEGVRRMSVGLQPSILEDVGVPGALRWYVEEVMRKVLPEVKLDMDDSLGRMPPRTEVTLYRIAQEALSNVARHAQASTVSISLKRAGDQVVLKITDNGVGFDPKASSLLDQRDHLGLFTIKERARLANGRSEVTSQPGNGTTVTTHLPLNEQQTYLEEQR